MTATDFLRGYGLEVSRQNKGVSVPSWIENKKGANEVTKIGIVITNSSGDTMMFNYYDSDINTKRGIEETTDNIILQELSYVSKFIDGMNFQEFCNGFGFSITSINSYNIYSDASRIYRELKNVLGKEFENFLTEFNNTFGIDDI